MEWFEELPQGWAQSLTHSLAFSSSHAQANVTLPHSPSQTQHSPSDVLSLTLHGTHADTCINTQSPTNTLPATQSHILSPVLTHGHSDIPHAHSLIPHTHAPSHLHMCGLPHTRTHSHTNLLTGTASTCTCMTDEALCSHHWRGASAAPSHFCRPNLLDTTGLST